MSDLLCIATIVLVGLVQASLQLSLGGLILFYHASMGSSSPTQNTLFGQTLYYRRCSNQFLNGLRNWFLDFFLFDGALQDRIFDGLRRNIPRKHSSSGGSSTSAEVIKPSLVVAKIFTRFINRRAKATNDNIEAFSLGMLSSFAEMPLSIALYFVVANCILTMSAQYQIFAILGYTLP